MMSALEGGLELLEHALTYTGVALSDVTEGQLDRPTPCADWSLRELLEHLADSLDAFIEAATGTVALIHKVRARMRRPTSGPRRDC